jgi:hypothetical protein
MPAPARGAALPFARGSSQSRRRHEVGSRLLLKFDRTPRGARGVCRWVGPWKAPLSLAHHGASMQAKIRGSNHECRRSDRSTRPADEPKPALYGCFVWNTRWSPPQKSGSPTIYSN